MIHDVFDARSCILGEGVIWHPERKQLFWFDILGRKLLSNFAGRQQEWNFDNCVSAAGWVDSSTLLIAGERALFTFDIETGKQCQVIPLETDNPLTRSNDGRADPWGGFWIGTMGKQAQYKAGAIYRYFKGELRPLFPSITIPNAICFSPDRRYGYFADTAEGMIWRQPLAEHDGWPVGEPELFINCRDLGYNPDGATVDNFGHLWNATWGAGIIVRYTPNGMLESILDCPAKNMTCVAFGGESLTTLFATSAQQEPSDPASRHAGSTFSFELGIQGLPEYQVIL
ncbi:SMP-30/gluconolactonase/LRE family protein [Azotobacter chroococcum]|uniref:Sugar lactone lactonase YvrE n=1 Tax=Azotobacter chroococcum TaxID=353 RepID=A0A4R1PBF9_9GAMM|nr:SMP-30/gluconolactonase/LRE family protein [Azotobacter chroococcum]TBV95407.1 SMP-30/gluconolactonase/LRE family protein [Azotobacter chroococcum]TCL22229.1 sugar lactone lactonase YvrE [Azotobacter chroococcum]